jgi:hypothetical protein
MKRLVVFCAAALLVIGSSLYAFGDIARPKPSTTPAEGKVIFHTGLQIVPDSKVWEARLQISPATLQRLREASVGTSANTSLTQRIMHSSTRTMMAGMFMFLAVSFAGIGLARSGQRRTQKAIAAVLLVAGTLGAATVIVRANAGPPGSYYWRKLPENLNKGEATRGGVNIEIMPGDDDGIKLIIPIKKNSLGEE